MGNLDEMYMAVQDMEWELEPMEDDSQQQQELEAQAEFENVELTSHFSEIMFKCGEKELLIATTRPELIPACVALFVHPDDERYKDLVGKHAKVPLFDYDVPIMSDVDIHIKELEDSSLFENLTDAFISSIGISQTYEDLFIEKNPTHLHIPRTQIVNLKDLENSVSVVFPEPEAIQVLLGKYPKYENKTADFVRRVDRFRLIEEEDFLSSLPRSVIDRTGIDLWTLIRRMVWRVSPSPIRLLTQTHDNPMDLWNCNRTDLVAILEDNASLILED